MGVIRVTEDGKKRSSEETADVRRLTRGFTVEFDGPSISNSVLARTAGGIPCRNDRHPADSFAICRRIQAKELSPVLYEVDVDYEAKYVGGDSPNASPLDAPWERSLGWQMSTEPVEDDAFGMPLCNVVGETFDPPLTLDITEPVLTITRNEASFDFGAAWRRANKTNTDDFYGAPPGMAKMLPITATEEGDNTFRYWRVTYQIAFRDPGPWPIYMAWWRHVINQGFKAAVDVIKTPYGVAGILRDITDDKGCPVTKPKFLTLDGQELPPGADVVWLHFPKYRGIVFSHFDLE